MRLVSWNVNGLRSCLSKGFLDFCAFADADVICLQETKMRPEQAEFDLPGYHRFWNSAAAPKVLPGPKAASTVCSRAAANASARPRSMMPNACWAVAGSQMISPR